MQKSISFSKGLTSAPSSLLSTDDTLAVSQGIISRDGEMHPIQLPVSIPGDSYPLAYIHKGPGFTNAVTYDDSVGSIRIASVDYSQPAFTPIAAFSVGKATAFSSVGNTLVVATTSGLHYYLYKAGSYINLGTQLPIPDVRFSLADQSDNHGNGTPCVLTDFLDYRDGAPLYDSSDRLTGFNFVLGDVVGTYHQISPKSGAAAHSDFLNAVQGQTAQRIARIKEDGRFYAPFFIRYALRLFDGSLARISAPIAVFPCVTRNSYFIPVKYDSDKNDYVTDTGRATLFYNYISSAKLRFSAYISGLQNWTDIVKEIVVFASDEVCPFYIDGKYSFANPMQTHGTAYYDYVGFSRYTPTSLLPDVQFSKLGQFDFSKKFDPFDVIIPEYKSGEDIISELISKSQFYKLFSVPVTASWTDIYSQDAPIKRGVVSNLAQQEQLPVDDYYGWATLVPQQMFAYNQRLNAIRCQRYPFSGFSLFSSGFSMLDPSANYSYYVHIVSASLDTWVRAYSGIYTYVDFADGWFFYPDPNASEVIVWDESNSRGMRLPLKRHPMLNGAYSFNRLPLDATFSPNTYTQPATSQYASETLSSQVFTSVVNNPFLFQASGDNTVGTGSILGITANTEAVTQGQFGQYPLIVFTTDGIYALSVNAEGLYSSAYPLSREVCNNAASITPTDRLVFFTSSKGLMAVSGSTVTCLSTQLDGRTQLGFHAYGGAPFAQHLQSALLAYDYPRSLLFILAKDSAAAYVYDMRSRTFATATMPGQVYSVVSNYPDTLIQYGSGQNGDVGTFRLIPHPETDTRACQCVFATRPLKLGSEMQLKTLRQIRHLHTVTQGTFQFAIYASNDCRTWTQLSSLHGKPWKYYIFRYSLSGISPADTFTGTVIDYLPRFTARLR